ncbi:MAG: hypothetical protein WKF46_08185 [Candidatus Limnocylindrales bacterium]
MVHRGAQDLGYYQRAQPIIPGEPPAAISHGPLLLDGFALRTD